MSQSENNNGNNEENNLNFVLNVIPNNQEKNINNKVKQIPNSNRTKLKNYITALKLRTSKYTLLPPEKRPDSSYKKIIYYISKLNEELKKFKEYNNLNTFNSNRKEAENNYISKISNLKQTIINSIKYWTIINKLYRDNYNNFDVSEIEGFFASLSQQYQENAVSFSKELYGNDTNQYPGYLKLYEQTKIDFEKKIKELKIIYEKNMNINITKIVELYIRQVKNFEYLVQDFYKTISDILHKLSDLTRSIASNDEMKQLNLKLSNKISIIFSNNSKKPSKNVNLKNLFNKITNGHQNKLKQQKNFINRFSNELKKENQKITFQYLLKFVNNEENKKLSIKDIQEFNEIPINDYFSKILTFYNQKLNTRINEINQLLVQYQALCVQLQASIALAQKSKTETSDLQKIERIQNKVHTIMTQYNQLKTIGNNCKNLGQKINKLNNAQQAPINTTENSLYLKDKNGNNQINMKTEINKAYFIFNYLFKSDTKRKLLSPIQYFIGDINSIFYKNGTVLADSDIYNDFKNKIKNSISNLETQSPRTASESNTTLNIIGRNKGYSGINEIKKLTYQERIQYAFINKEWLVNFLEKKNAINN